MKTIVLTGGGTAGHIMPNVALIPELKNHFDRIIYIGTEKGMEKNIISKINGVEFISIEAVKLVRKLTLKNLLIPFKLIRSIKNCKKILKEIKPDVIFSKGGYVSVPVVYAAKNTPIISHESDYSLGLANKLIARKCTYLLTSFRETCFSDKCIYTGSPIREEIFKGDKNKAQKLCKFKNNKPVILIFGGSLGSKNINNTVFESIDYLQEYNIIHIVGKNNKKAIQKDNYYQIEYAENIWDYFALADFVISRAGANSIFETLALKKPMLLIPLGKAQSRGDQIENAKAFKKMGVANILMEENLNKQSFINAIKKLNSNKDKLIENMKKQAKVSSNKLIVNKILEAIKDKKNLTN